MKRDLEDAQEVVEHGTPDPVSRGSLFLRPRERGRGVQALDLQPAGQRVRFAVRVSAVKA